MSNNIIKPVPKLVKLNEHVTLRVIQLTRQKNGEAMVPAYVNMLRGVLEKMNVLPYGETPTFISFIQAKRSFVVRTNAGKFYLITAYLTNNVSWIYEVRRSLGQPSCCARAHATSQGLPSLKLERTYQEKYNAFLSANMLPCQKHFLENLDDPYKYVRTTAARNSLRLDENEIGDTTKITYRLLIRLIGGETPFSAQIPTSEAKEMHEAELVHMRVTQLSDIGLILSDCREILTDIEQRVATLEEQDIDLVALLALKVSVTGAVDALKLLAEQMEQGKAGIENLGRLYKNMEVIKVIQRQIQSVQFSMFII